MYLLTRTYCRWSSRLSTSVYNLVRLNPFLVIFYPVYRIGVCQLSHGGLAVTTKHLTIDVESPCTQLNGKYRLAWLSHQTHNPQTRMKLVDSGNACQPGCINYSMLYDGWILSRKPMWSCGAASVLLTILVWRTGP